MNDLIRWTVAVLIATMVLAVIPTEAEGEIYEDTLRLHILANSDSAEDQALKLRIRDKLLLTYGEKLRDGASIDEAKLTVTGLLSFIENDVETWIREMGYDYEVKAMLGEEWYDTRDYGDFSLPAGYYSSLRIIIGNGSGQNWWCVMYPPMCMELACESAPADDGVVDYSKEEIALIKSGKYQVKFKILEDLSRMFAKNS